MIVVGVEHRDLLVVVADSHVAALVGVVVEGVVVVLRLGAVDKLDCGRTLSMISHVVESKHQSWNAS